MAGWEAQRRVGLFRLATTRSDDSVAVLGARVARAAVAEDANVRLSAVLSGSTKPVAGAEQGIVVVRAQHHQSLVSRRPGREEDLYGLSERPGAQITEPEHAHGRSLDAGYGMVSR